jgi:hypothetical protein
VSTEQQETLDAILRQSAFPAGLDVHEQRLDDDEPDLGRLESARNWFIRKLPALSGAVVSLILHPLVGRLVEAAGDALAAEYRRRFTDTA